MQNLLLNNINRFYCGIGFILFIAFLNSSIQEPAFFALYLVSFLSFSLFGIVIIAIDGKTSSFFNKRNLFIIVFACTFFQVLIYKILSFYIDGDTFLFAKRDAMLYYLESLKIAQMDFMDTIKYISSILGFDDWGVILWFSTIFRVIGSNDFSSFVHCLVGTTIALLLFDICRNLMPKRYAFICSFSFSIASFMLVSYSTTVKQTIMVFIIIAAFDCFYNFLRKKKNRSLFLCLIYSSLILLFRIPTALFLIFSFGITLILLYMKGPSAIALTVILGLALCSTSLFSYTFDRYLRGGNTELMLERKNQLAGDGGIVNQLADPVAALAGPFPSIKIQTIKATSLYASGLLYRFLLCAPFFLGTYLIIKKQYVKMYPFVIFFLVNAIGVAISVKGLETRLSLPHMAMMYIVAFWFLARYDYGKLSWKISHPVSYSYFIFIMGLCLLWNLR